MGLRDAFPLKQATAAQLDAAAEELEVEALRLVALRDVLWNKRFVADRASYYFAAAGNYRLAAAYCRMQEKVDDVAKRGT